MMVFVFKHKLSGAVTVVHAPTLEAAALRLYQRITQRVESAEYGDACAAVVLKTHDVLARNAEVLT